MPPKIAKEVLIGKAIKIKYPKKLMAGSRGSISTVTLSAIDKMKDAVLNAVKTLFGTDSGNILDAFSGHKTTGRRTDQSMKNMDNTPSTSIKLDSIAARMLSANMMDPKIKNEFIRAMVPICAKIVKIMEEHENPQRALPSLHKIVNIAKPLLRS